MISSSVCRMPMHSNLKSTRRWERRRWAWDRAAWMEREGEKGCQGGHANSANWCSARRDSLLIFQRGGGGKWGFFYGSLNMFYYRTRFQVPSGPRESRTSHAPHETFGHFPEQKKKKMSRRGNPDGTFFFFFYRKCLLENAFKNAREIFPAPAAPPLHPPNSCLLSLLGEEQFLTP